MRYAHRVVCVCDGHVRVYTIYVSAIDSEKAQPRCKKANFESVLLTGSSTLQYTAPELPYLCVCGPESAWTVIFKEKWRSERSDPSA